MRILKKILLLATALLLTALPVPAEEAFEEILLADNDSVSVSVVGVDPDGIWGYTLKLLLENKTASSMMFCAQSASVNGYMSDPIWSAIVGPDSLQEEELCFSTLETDGVTGSVSSICLSLEVRDYADFTSDPVLSGLFTVLPAGDSAAPVIGREPQPEDIALFSDGNVSMTVIGFQNDEIWGSSLRVYLENHTEQSLMFSIPEASVNGKAVDPLWAFSLLPGTRAYSEVLLNTDSDASNPITAEDEIILNVSVRDAADWDAAAIIDGLYVVSSAE